MVPRKFSLKCPQANQILTDSYGRNITYLRLAITDRCNLKCNYCMPIEGIQFIPRYDSLSFEELERIIVIFVKLGINKVRITGGEPFARKDTIQFLKHIRRLPFYLNLFITTNGVLASQYFKELESINPDGINLSLDTLRSDRFYQITHCHSFNLVERFLQDLLQSKIPLKINTVVQPGVNEDEILSIARLARDHPLEVRFIERMPFNGNLYKKDKLYSGKDIENQLRSHFSGIEKIKSPDNSTAQLYKIEGYQGVIGIISGYSRTFCSSCNKIRVSTQGHVKTCLYAHPTLNLKMLLRAGYTDEQIEIAIINVVNKRFENGYRAEQRTGQNIYNSMSLIGG